MQINNLIETIRLKYSPEENIITIFNLNLHTERLLNSITELNFKINENSEKSLMFFSKDFSNIALLDE
jgi:branched-subunit amino acid aminotransferase/4-amino-4-deoxychorismate lyase